MNDKPRIGFYHIWFSLGSFKLKCIKTIDYVFGSMLVFLLPPQQAVPIDRKAIKRVLIIRPGGLGDAIFLMPYIRILHEKNVRVDVLCEQRNAGVFTGQAGLLNKIYLSNELTDIWTILGQKYNVIIDTEQWHYLSGILGYFIKADQRVGFKSRDLREKLYTDSVPYDVNAYELINFGRLFSKVMGDIGMFVELEGSLNVSKEAADWAAEQLSGQSVAFFIGASVQARRLTIEQSVAIVAAIIIRGFQVVLLRGVDVCADAARIEKQLSNACLINMVGKASLMQSAAFIRISKFFIGSDSGLMHLACALNKDVLAIFGPGQMNKWAPTKERHRIFTIHAPCAPCTAFGYTVPTCKGSFFGMKDISVNDIIAAIEDKLNG